MTGLSITIEEKRFAVSSDGAPCVLKDVNLTIDPGQFVCILGSSGCGKTTLLRIIAGLDDAYSGSVSLPAADGGGVAKLAYVFQEPVLLPWRSVLQNLHLVMSDDQIERGLAEWLLEAVGLGAVKDAFPGTLSLGMSRRVSLTRAFAVEPDILLMDEPFVSLDETTAKGLRDLLQELLREKPATVLFVTHDSREAIRLGQRIVVLADKKPTGIVHDHVIGLSEVDRHDAAKVEALREELAGI